MDFEKLNDESVLALVNTELDSATSYFDSQVAENRQENEDYYSGALPAQRQRGRSKYVSGDVFDVVESVKASLLETFSGNRTIVEFTPENGDDTEQARIATEYTNYVFYRQNKGYGILQTVIHDALLYRIGVVKPYWKTSSYTESYDFTNVPMQQLIAISEQEGIEELDYEEKDLGPLVVYSGTFVKRVDTSHVAIATLAPEEFLISEGAKSIEEAKAVSHRVKHSISSLIKEGYSRKEAVAAYESSVESEGPQTTSIDSSWEMSLAEATQKQTEEFWVYETYIELDVEGKGEAKLFKVISAGDVLLDKEEVDSKPFFAFSPLVNPHELIGADFVEKLKPIQNSKTTLTRSILDHTVITNNPRMQVVKGTLHNTRELLDDRLGGLVNVTRPDGLLPLPQSPMNPYAFNTIQMMDDNKEQATGVSRLSQGINKDAVSKQNSSDMINGLVNLSQQRQKTIARNLAELFLKPLFIYIYKLVLENEDKESVIEVAGNYVPIDPTKWAERKDASVEFTIGYQEADREAQELLGIYREMAQDPVLAQGFGYDKRYAMYQKILEKKGIKDIQTYLTPPDKIQPQQPSPMDQIQVELAKQSLDINERQTAHMEQKLALDKYKLARGMELDESRVEMDILAKAEKQDLDETKFNHSQAMDFFEQEIVRKKAMQGDITASANVTTGGA